MKFIMSLHLSFLPLLHFFLFFLESDGQDVNMLQEYCPESSCSGIVVRYPFRRTDTSSIIRTCGYKGFGINCVGVRPIFYLHDSPYIVTNINYVDKTLNLVHMSENDPTCPRLSRNLTVEGLPLEYSSQDLNLAFYFNCSSGFDHGGVIDCLSSGGNRSYVFEGVEPQDVEWYGFCEEKVLTSLVNTNIRVGWPNVNFGMIMNQGFELQWGTSTECRECEESDGRCGYNESNQVLCFCKDGSISYNRCKKADGGHILFIIGGIATFIVIVVAVLFFFIRRRKMMIRRSLNGKNGKVEAFMKKLGSIGPQQYSYSEIKTMTNSFEHKLGQGGYGSVYKGNLSDGRLVAVKVLSETKGNGEDFINEISSISKTSHVNIVSLLGFSCHQNRRALIYQFMPNGSLDEFITRKRPSNSSSCLDCNTLYKIAIGAARGLEYLHRDCNTRIVHLDIKPHNILLDGDFCPKISDFGLAKLSETKESYFSKCSARGTIGYIAPEMVFRNFGSVSHKSDVYSYGMMVLEMVGVRTNPSGTQANRSSQMYFPNWIYEHLEHGTDLPSSTIQIDTEEEEGVKTKLIIIGLSCVQTNPSERPSMSEVLEMLEGSFQSLTIPPRQSLLYSLSDVPHLSSSKSQESSESSIYTHQSSDCTYC